MCVSAILYSILGILENALCMYTKSLINRAASDNILNHRYKPFTDPIGIQRQATCLCCRLIHIIHDLRAGQGWTWSPSQIVLPQGVLLLQVKLPIHSPQPLLVAGSLLNQEALSALKMADFQISRPFLSLSDPFDSWLGSRIKWKRY